MKDDIELLPCREAFEAWFRKEFNEPHRSSSVPDCYNTVGTQIAWEAFQAGMNTRPQSPPQDKEGALEMMIDDAIGALKAIRHEVGNGLKLSVRSQNLGYQALDKLTAFQQHGYAALTPKPAEGEHE